ncbi:MAG: hypothetical protein ABIS14_00185, partial [Sphingomonas sp.]
SAADFAESVERMRGTLRVIIQRGRLQCPKNLPKIAAVLDQFVVEQDYDEEQESWHPKLALVGYKGPGDERAWRLWIGSRNLTRSRDLDLGLLIDGEAKRRKGTRPLPGVAQIGRRLAALSGLADFPPDAVSAELEPLCWRAPDDIALDSIALHERGSAATTPLPMGAVERVVAVSPFLCPGFVTTMAGWGDADTRRDLVTTLAAVRGLSLKAKRALKPFRLLALAPPQAEQDDALALPTGNPDPSPQAQATEAQAAAAPADNSDAEPVPVSLHAKLFAFSQKKTTRVVMGSANATARAWSGRNAEAVVTFDAGPLILTGIEALIGSAMPIPREILDEPATSDDDEPAAQLDRCRAKLVAGWPLSLTRTLDHFVLQAGSAPMLGHRGIRLEAGLATGALVPWPDGKQTLVLGEVPLAWQTDLLQLRLVLGDASCAWLQRAPVDPPIAADRDRAAIGRFLGVRAFYAWMRGLLDGDLGTPDNESWEHHQGDERAPLHGRHGLDDLTLEDILTAWTRDEIAFRRTDARFETYLAAILAHDETLLPEDRRALEALRGIWGAARQALLEKR